MLFRILIFTELLIFSILLVSAVDIKVQGMNPSEGIVSFFEGEGQNFSIQEGVYDNIQWYLNGELVSHGVNFYEIKGLKSGIYVLRVDIIKNDSGDSNTWNLIVKKSTFSEAVGMSWLNLGYYAAMGVLIIIIFLIVRLIILERKDNPLKLIE